jgi:hypothetical protein
MNADFHMAEDLKKTGNGKFFVMAASRTST